MKKFPLQLTLISLAIFAYVLKGFLTFYPEIIERYYSKGLNKWFIQHLSQVTSLIPFSLFECLIYLAVFSLLATFIYTLIQMISHPQRCLAIVGECLLNLMTAFSIGYFIFLLFWA